jgi:hypothetical protein
MTTCTRPSFVTLSMLAYLLQLPATWLEQEAKSGRIPALGIGGRLRFNVEAVEAELSRRAANERLTQEREQSHGAH